MAFKEGSFEGETLFGVFYPKGYLVAVLNDQASAEQVADELRQAGYNQVDIRSAQDVKQRHQAFMAQRTTLQRLGSAFAADEKLALEDYLQAADEDRTFVTAHVLDHADLGRTQAILRVHGASMVHYYGSAGMEDLSAN